MAKQKKEKVVVTPGEVLTAKGLLEAIQEGKNVVHDAHGVKKASVVGNMTWISVSSALKSGQIKAVIENADPETEN